jgi:PKD repeat protein
VEVFDQSGCAATPASVTVDIAETPEAAFSISQDAPCVLPTTVDFANLSTGASTYEWNFGNGDFSSDENPSTLYGAAGTYTVTLTVTSPLGCTDVATETVIIDQAPVAGFSVDPFEGCAPLAVTFGNSSSSGLEYMWNFGDGTSSNLANPTHVYDIPGEYEVSLIVSGAGGCLDTLTLEGAVSVYPSPIADFTANPSPFGEAGNEFDFVNNSVGADLYNWDFGNGDETDEESPFYTYPEYGGYFVTLTAINEFGCADTATHYVSVDLETTLFVPNAMAIGEPGEASLFLPKGEGIADYHVWVFDNWGNLLWESTALENGSPAEGWDGYYKGQTVPQGSYVWKINATFVDGEVWEGVEYSNGKNNTGTIMVIY